MTGHRPLFAALSWNKTQVLTKSMNMDTWVIDTLNQLFIRDCCTQIEFLKKQNSQWQTSVFVTGPFCAHFVLASDRAVLYGNVLLSVVALATKKQYSIFLETVLVFQKTFFKVKVLKTFLKLQWMSNKNSPTLVRLNNYLDYL